MDKMIREEIIRTFNLPKVVGKQLEKSYLLQKVSYVCDCTQKDVNRVYSQMKKEGRVYSVNGLAGWVGLHDEEV